MNWAHLEYIWGVRFDCETIRNQHMSPSQNSGKRGGGELYNTYTPNKTQIEFLIHDSNKEGGDNNILFQLYTRKSSHNLIIIV